MVEREAEALERRSGDGLVIGGRVAEEEREKVGRQLRGEVRGGGGIVSAAALQVEQPCARGGAVGLRGNLRHLPVHRRRLHEGGEWRPRVLFLARRGKCHGVRAWGAFRVWGNCDLT